MAKNDYRLQSEWRIPARLGEVAGLIREAVEDVQIFVQHWPEANVAFRVLTPGLPGGLHRELELSTKGFLPYRLRWRLKITAAEFPHRYAFASRGDFEGIGVWTIVAQGSHVVVRFEWCVRVHKPIVRVLSFWLRPLFVANHRWAMAQGERRMIQLLEERRRETEPARCRFAAPPPRGNVADIRQLANT
ncbi:MAG: hypothetical protein AAF628_37410 [Planctomycetota bacterium]